MVVFDATILILWFAKNAKPPVDPATSLPVTLVKERIAYLIDSLSKAKTRIIVPTPAFSELMVHAEKAGPEWSTTISRSSYFKVADFDQLAAIEVAAVIRDARIAGEKRSGSEATWAKVKFDRMIVAIAKVQRATTIYSDDSDIRRHGQASGLDVIGTAELPLPAQGIQASLDLDPPSTPDKPESLDE